MSPSIFDFLSFFIVCFYRRWKLLEILLPFHKIFNVESKYITQLSGDFVVLLYLHILPTELFLFVHNNDIRIIADLGEGGNLPRSSNLDLFFVLLGKHFFRGPRKIWLPYSRNLNRAMYSYVLLQELNEVEIVKIVSYAKINLIFTSLI